MNIKILLLTALLLISCRSFTQTYPSFGPEKKVTINGLTFDAMEPFISADGNTLFFNSLNSGGNTNLYYASRVNDTTFNFVAMVDGTYDSTANHLDAVASMDSLNNFYWVSLRSIPNLHRGNFLNGAVSDVSKVYGDFNIFTPGWLIMDACINYTGDLLYYSNAYFGPTYTECVGVPCEAKLGVADRVNDSTFSKWANSDDIFAQVNDTNYIVYAPQVTKDGLELYFSRLLKGGFDTELCVSVRDNDSEAFSAPIVIYSNFGFFPEAATPSTDKQKIYYHLRDNTFVHGIYLRYRTSPTGIADESDQQEWSLFPNPASDLVHVHLPEGVESIDITVYSLLGEMLLTRAKSTKIDLSNLAQGVYYLSAKQNNKCWTTKIVKN